MTNGQNAIVSGVKHRLKLISDPSTSETEKAGYRDWIVFALEHYINEYNFVLGVDKALAVEVPANE